MADANDDVKEAEITPDDFDGDAQDDSKADPKPAKDDKAKERSEPKSKEPEVAKGKEVEAQADDTAAEPDIPTKDEGEAEEAAAETEDKPQGKAEDRKATLNTEIRDLVSQRNALREEVEKANAEVYQPATENELVDQGMTDLEAKVEAMRQQTEMEKYNNRVADAQLTISSESERVLNDFPQFNPDSESYDKETAEEAADLLRANLIIDQNSGQVIGSNVSPYQLYKTLARASGISAAKGQIKGQADTEKMLANADTGSGAAPPKEKVDPLMELWKSDD